MYVCIEIDIHKIAVLDMAFAMTLLFFVADFVGLDKEFPPWESPYRTGDMK